MSRPAGIEAIRKSSSPGSLKRKRDTPDSLHHTTLSSVSSYHGRLVNGKASSPSNRSPRVTGADGLHSSIRYQSPASDENHHTESGDLLHGVGSVSSLASGASSVFSHHSHIAGQNNKSAIGSVSTPLTTRSDSSPSKFFSPQSSACLNDMATINGNDAVLQSSKTSPFDTSSANLSRPQMLPPPGKAKGYRAVWDPELDGKLSKEERKRATVRKRDFGTEIYEPDPPPDPRLAIPGYMSGNCRNKLAPSKAILRIAPYALAPYKLDRHSIGPGEAQQIVVVGFDPFLSEATLRLNFSTFGSIASVQNKTDPETGSFLGIAQIKYRDTVRDGEQVSAATAAKRAETDFNGARIGSNTIKVELDREGRRCQRFVEAVLQRARNERMKENAITSIPPPPSAPEPSNSIPAGPAPPPNAPKGPSGKPTATKAPEGPRAAAPVNAKAAASSLVEEEAVLGKIKRKPYLHIPHSSVPVLGTTIPHLKKRLKAYDWREIRLDATGYYVVFEDSKRGEDETERCYNECNKAALFTYSMEMECQKYGNPNYERSPSPERALEEKKKKEDFERLLREEEEDMEVEKKRRAEDLDPVLGALEQLRAELKDRIMSDIKTRVAIPIFHESLEPAKHITQRRKLGLPDPSDVESKGPTLLFNKTGDTLQNFRGRPHSKPLRPHDPNQRGRRGDRDRLRPPENVFVDERRRKPAGRASHARGLHFRLQQMYAEEEDSDDERQTSITHDTEDQESRPLSRASRTSTPFDSESVADSPPKNKRRKASEWDEEDKEEAFNPLHKDLLGHLLQKEPEDLATRELELVVNTLPRSSKFATRARTELFLRQRSKADDDLFQIQIDSKRESVENDLPTTDTDRKSKTNALADSKVTKEKVKKRRKTKKELLQEQALLKAAVQHLDESEPAVSGETIRKPEEKEVEVEAEIEVPEEAEDEDKDIAWSFTHDKPRRTVEDDQGIVLDIDGWQNAVKDDEDFGFAKQALFDLAATELGDVKLWAWRQKEIKALNTGVYGPVQSETGIEGYYVPNSTGSARTEGVKKILNEEKSKYLPHRIKVQKAREERQALAKDNPTAAAEAAKIAAAERMASTAASRSKRVDNRRLINDINLQKQTLATVNSDADVAIRFNQLKKRKKLVKFDRSAIHGWGLYAEENIAVNDLIIEYVGEKVRQKVADMREQKYDRQGVGSSYLFRMMDDEIVDATKKGGIARFINHSCNPNCTAKIIKVEGTPRIVIYALKDILKNDELTYDYKFEREYGATDRIPCLCGSANCKGFLN